MFERVEWCSSTYQLDGLIYDFVVVLICVCSCLCNRNHKIGLCSGASKVARLIVVFICNVRRK